MNIVIHVRLLLRFHVRFIPLSVVLVMVCTFNFLSHNLLLQMEWNDLSIYTEFNIILRYALIVYKEINPVCNKLVQVFC